MTTVVTRQDLRAGLARLGLGRDDTALVHASTSSFGYVVGGVVTVVDAILETVGQSSCPASLHS